MFRFIFNAIGFLLLAVAAMFAVIDGTKSIATSKLTFTSFGGAWRDLQPGTLDSVQQFLENHAPVLWNPVMTTALIIPASVIVALAAFVFLKLGDAGRSPYI